MHLLVTSKIFLAPGSDEKSPFIDNLHIPCVKKLTDVSVIAASLKGDRFYLSRNIFDKRGELEREHSRSLPAQWGYFSDCTTLPLGGDFCIFSVY